jgi:hypothetical protein
MNPVQMKHEPSLVQVKSKYAPFVVVFVGAVTIVSFNDINMSPTFNVMPKVNDIEKDKSDRLDSIVLNTTETKRSLHVFIPPHLTGYITSHSTTNRSPFVSTSRS